MLENLENYWFRHIVFFFWSGLTFLCGSVLTALWCHSEFSFLLFFINSCASSVGLCLFLLRFVFQRNHFALLNTYPENIKDSLTEHKYLFFKDLTAAMLKESGQWEGDTAVKMYCRYCAVNILLHCLSSWKERPLIWLQISQNTKAKNSNTWTCTDILIVYHFVLTRNWI